MGEFNIFFSSFRENTLHPRYVCNISVICYEYKISEDAEVASIHEIQFSREDQGTNMD